jgi:hypothetical protein
MPYYEYRCRCGETLESYHAMGEAPTMIDGVHVDRVAEQTWHCEFRRVFSFTHVEDRRHMRKGKSLITGMEYAKSRTEERAIEKSLGIEFVGKSEEPVTWKRLREYRNHLATGGERLPNEEINPEPVTSTKGDLLKKAAELGVNLNVS